METSIRSISKGVKEVSFDTNLGQVTLKLQGSRTMRDLTNLLYAVATGIEGTTVPNQSIDDLKY